MRTGKSSISNGMSLNSLSLQICTSFTTDAKRDYSRDVEFYNYTWQTFLGGCRFWNDENETWSSEGCTVSNTVFYILHLSNKWTSICVHLSFQGRLVYFTFCPYTDTALCGVRAVVYFNLQRPLQLNARNWNISPERDVEK